MKKLTKEGEKFIRTICNGQGDSLIKGRFGYNLPFSEFQNTGVTFTANAVDPFGNTIVTNEQLGEALIVWYNRYAELTNLDANVLAAQGYEESGYRLWYYNGVNSGCGLADLTSIDIYKYIVRSQTPETLEGLATPQFDQNEIDRIIQNTTDPLNRLSYIYRGDRTTPELAQTAIDNRYTLYQNIVNNPELSIKAQAIILSQISIRNNGLKPNILFAYHRNHLLSANSYIDLTVKSGRKYGDEFTKKGIDYVDRIYRYLGDKNNDKLPKKINKPVGIWFGINVNFKQDSFTANLG